MHGKDVKGLQSENHISRHFHVIHNFTNYMHLQQHNIQTQEPYLQQFAGHVVCVFSSGSQCPWQFQDTTTPESSLGRCRTSNCHDHPLCSEHRNISEI